MPGHSQDGCSLIIKIDFFNNYLLPHVACCLYLIQLCKFSICILKNLLTPFRNGKVIFTPIAEL